MNEYTNHNGHSCPVCGGKILDKAPPSWPEVGKIFVWVGCESCRHTWREIYQLQGYDELTHSPKGDPTATGG